MLIILRIIKHQNVSELFLKHCMYMYILRILGNHQFLNFMQSAMYLPMLIQLLSLYNLNVIKVMVVGAKNQNYYHQYRNITQFRNLLSPSIIRSYLFGTRCIARHCLWNILSDRFYNCFEHILKLQPKVINLCSM